MLPSLHLNELTPDERFRELARILANGVLWLDSRVLAAETPSHPDAKIHSEFSTNELAVCGKKSVTVHVGYRPRDQRFPGEPRWE